MIKQLNHDHDNFILYFLFNIKFRVISPIDKKPMDGIPSIRVHHGLDFANSNHIIRWTEVFILKVRYFISRQSHTKLLQIPADKLT